VFCAAGFVGIETFSYTVQNTSLTATVTVNVTVGSCDGSSCTVGDCNDTTGAPAAAAATAALAAGLFANTSRMPRLSHRAHPFSLQTFFLHMIGSSSQRGYADGGKFGTTQAVCDTAWGPLQTICSPQNKQQALLRS
jgi:hypothetical protein